MTDAELKTILEESIAKLFEHQPDMFEFTSATGQTEWNLAHHLANELCAFFPKLECDLDVVKRDYGDKRPDIIFHRRGTHRSNYLVIELKREGQRGEIDDDIEKIKEEWFRPPLHYRFGAVVDLRSDGRHEIQVFRNTT